MVSSWGLCCSFSLVYSFRFTLVRIFIIRVKLFVSEFVTCIQRFNFGKQKHIMYMDTTSRCVNLNCWGCKRFPSPLLLLVLIHLHSVVVHLTLSLRFLLFSFFPYSHLDAQCQWCWRWRCIINWASLGCTVFIVCFWEFITLLPRGAILVWSWVQERKTIHASSCGRWGARDVIMQLCRFFEQRTNIPKCSIVPRRTELDHWFIHIHLLMCYFCGFYGINQVVLMVKWKQMTPEGRMNLSNFMR